MIEPNQPTALAASLVLSLACTARAQSTAASLDSACVSDECSAATIEAYVAVELRAAQLGRSHATDPRVKAAADRMANDFGAARAGLEAYLKQAGIAGAPCDTSRRLRARLDAHLSRLEGAQSFDAAYVRTQTQALADVQDAINLELIGCAAGGALKTLLRSHRGRIAADLEASSALIGGGAASAPFIHPGILVTRPQLDFLRAQIAARKEPWTSAFRRASDDARASLDYRPHFPHASPRTPLTPATSEGVVLCGSFSDPDVHCSHEKDDAVAASSHALLWALGGDDRHAQKAIALLNGWSILEDHGLFNAALQAGWTGTQFARAAEIMQLHPGWSAADVARFKQMMRRAFLPRLLEAGRGQNGNWALSIADSLIQIGVLLDEREAFERGVALWRAHVPAYCYLSSLDGALPRLPPGGYSGSQSGYAPAASRRADPHGYWGQAGRALPDGISQETCRDQEHVQYGLAALVNGAETARIQGVDLFREQAARIAACMEFAASWVDQGRDTPAQRTPLAAPVIVPAPNTDLCLDAEGKPQITLLASGAVGTSGMVHPIQPTWEIGYNALANRLGMSMPAARKVIEILRAPPKGFTGATHHMAWETLTHGDVDRRSAVHKQHAPTPPP
jgi:predicted outer membrane protein